MNKIIDIKTQIKHVEKCLFTLRSDVELLYFKDYINKEYKGNWNNLSPEILGREGEKWILKRSDTNYQFELNIN
jgi:hypothetical protein